MLYIIPSPIGNLDDFTYRAVKLLPTLDYLLCEDTRKTQLLIKRYFQNEVKLKLLPYHEINENEKTPKVLDLLKGGLNVGLISDAGTPTINDPGFKLVRNALQEGIKTVSLPGPSAVITALAGSGLPTDRFTFIGYIPKKTGDLIRLWVPIKENKNLLGTVIAYDSPYRIKNNLEKIKTIVGDINVVVARELTKIYESYYSGKISEVIKKLPAKIKGEITVLFTLNDQ